VGKILIIIGIIFILAGVAFNFGLLNWFGNLPGDINYKGENVQIFIPITSMLIVSIVLSLLFWLFS